MLGLKLNHVSKSGQRSQAISSYGIVKGTIKRKICKVKRMSCTDVQCFPNHFVYPRHVPLAHHGLVLPKTVAASGDTGNHDMDIFSTLLNSCEENPPAKSNMYIHTISIMNRLFHLSTLGITGLYTMDYNVALAYLLCRGLPWNCLCHPGEIVSRT